MTAVAPRRFVSISLKEEFWDTYHKNLIDTAEEFLGVELFDTREKIIGLTDTARLKEDYTNLYLSEIQTIIGIKGPLIFRQLSFKLPNKYPYGRLLASMSVDDIKLIYSKISTHKKVMKITKSYEDRDRDIYVKDWDHVDLGALMLAYADFLTKKKIDVTWCSFDCYFKVYRTPLLQKFAIDALNETKSHVKLPPDSNTFYARS